MVAVLGALILTIGVARTVGGAISGGGAALVNALGAVQTDPG